MWLVTPVIKIGILLATFLDQQAHGGEIMIDQFPNGHVGSAIVNKGQEVQRDLGVGIDGEDARGRDGYAPVGEGVGESVAKAGVEGCALERVAAVATTGRCLGSGGLEEIHDVAETAHLEYLRLAEIDFAAECSHGTVGTHDYGAAGKAVAILTNSIEIGACRVCLSYRP